MSSDNGIYIAKFPDGYRVTYASAIENITYHRKGTKARKQELKKYFGNSPIFTSEKAAFDYAYKTYEEMQEEEEKNGMLGQLILEYGVCFIGEYESFL
jgi:hypothetical protein